MGQFPNIQDLDMSQAIGGQSSSDVNQSIIDYTNQAQNQGIGYGFGSKDPQSGAIDCSGWLSNVANKLGYNLSGSAADMAQQAENAGALKQNDLIRPGDIVFGSGAQHAQDRFKGIGHTGLVVQNGNRLFVSESSANGPTLTPIENFVQRYQGRLYSAPMSFAQGQTAREDVMGQRLNELQARSQRQPQQIAQGQPEGDFYNQGMNFFTSKGYSPAQAAGIVGNLMHESGGNPDILHDSGKGYGLAGWNGDRRKALYQFTGTDRPDINQQLAFVDYELRNSEPKAYQALQQAKSPEQAAQLFSQLYERPGRPMMNERIAHSRKAMNAYAMGQASSMAAGPATPSGMPDISQLDMGQAIKSPDVSQLDMNQLVEGPEEKSVAQMVASKVAPYLPVAGFGAGALAGGLTGGMAEYPAIALGSYLGNQAKDWAQRYAGDKPGYSGNLEALAESGKNIMSGAMDAASTLAINKATEPIFNYLATKIAPRLYQHVLKPSTTLTQPERQAILNTGIEGGYPVSRGGIDKVSIDMKNLMAEVDDLVGQATQTGQQVSLKNAAARLDDTIAKYSNSPIPSEYIDKIKAFRDTMLKERGNILTPEIAQEMKRTIYKLLPDSAYGEQFTTLTKDMRKDLARGLKEELESIIPELKNLNKSWGAKAEFKDILERAVGRIDNRYPLSFLDAIAGGTVGGMTHDPLAGIGTALASKVMMDPTVNSYIAMALKRMPLSNYRKLLTSSLGYGAAQPVENKLADALDKWRANQLTPSFQP